MTISQELGIFVISLIAALIPVIPVAVGLIITYLKTVENKVAIQSVPTQDAVTAQIDEKIAAIPPITGGTTSGNPAEPTTTS